MTLVSQFRSEFSIQASYVCHNTAAYGVVALYEYYSTSLYSQHKEIIINQLISWMCLCVPNYIIETYRKLDSTRKFDLLRQEYAIKDAIVH